MLERKALALLSDIEGIAREALPDSPLARLGTGVARVPPARTTLDPVDRRFRLFDYQRDLADRLAALAETPDRGLLSLPTGGGKTRTAVAAMLDALQTAPYSAWAWLAPTKELLQQAYETTVLMWRELDRPPRVKISFGGTPDPDTAIWFTTPQAINASPFPPGLAFRAVVFDEAHQVAAPTFRSAFLSLSNAGAAMIGLSATPGRTDPNEVADLVDIFNGHLLVTPILGEQPVQALQTRGVLSRLKFHRIRAEEPLSASGRLPATLELCRRLATEGRRILVFTESVAGAIAGSAWLGERGVRSSYVEGNLDDDERKVRLEAFGSGGLSVMLNQRLLATGYDCPAVTDVVLESRVGSSILFEQIVGRVARGPVTGGASVGHVWQFDDHLALHGRPQSYYRYRDFLWTVDDGKGVPN